MNHGVGVQLSSWINSLYQLVSQVLPSVENACSHFATTLIESGLTGAGYFVIIHLTDMRKLCIFATHHQFQVDSPMDSAFDGHLRELINCCFFHSSDELRGGICSCNALGTSFGSQR
jgi:hypothetical protein